jgi:hypothetical protein
MMALMLLLGAPYSMSRRPLRFKESDLRRALRAVQKSGAHMAVEISPDGTIRMVPAQPGTFGKALKDEDDTLGDSPW